MNVMFVMLPREDESHDFFLATLFTAKLGYAYEYTTNNIQHTFALFLHANSTICRMKLKLVKSDDCKLFSFVVHAHWVYSKRGGKGANISSHIEMVMTLQQYISK